MKMFDSRFVRWTSTIAALATLLAIAGCKKKPEELPPVSNGSSMRFFVQKILGNSSVDMDVTLKFAQAGDDWKVDFVADAPQPSVSVDWWLEPDKGVIETYGLGKLWVPSGSRRAGVATNCGRTDKQRKFRQWDVWEISGNCGLLQGAWYYEANTGMLVGWQVRAPAGEFSAYLLEAT